MHCCQHGAFGMRNWFHRDTSLQSHSLECWQTQQLVRRSRHSARVSRLGQLSGRVPSFSLPPPHSLSSFSSRNRQLGGDEQLSVISNYACIRVHARAVSCVATNGEQLSVYYTHMALSQIKSLVARTRDFAWAYTGELASLALRSIGRLRKLRRLTHSRAAQLQRFYERMAGRFALCSSGLVAFIGSSWLSIRKLTQFARELKGLLP